jgi:PAT family beta-lactamase induction signal transducer AmpG
VINKGVGFWGLIVGVALAAPFMAWLGMGRALFASAC